MKDIIRFIEGQIRRDDFAGRNAHNVRGYVEACTTILKRITQVESLQEPKPRTPVRTKSLRLCSASEIVPGALVYWTGLNTDVVPEGRLEFVLEREESSGRLIAVRKGDAQTLDVDCWLDGLELILD